MSTTSIVRAIAASVLAGAAGLAVAISGAAAAQADPYVSPHPGTVDEDGTQGEFTVAVDYRGQAVQGILDVDGTQDAYIKGPIIFAKP